MDAQSATANGFSKEPIEVLMVTEFILNAVEAVHYVGQDAEEDAEEIFFY